jgi:hypothetical protein
MMAEDPNEIHCHLHLRLYLPGRSKQAETWLQTILHS